MRESHIHWKSNQTMNMIFTLPLIDKRDNQDNQDNQKVL